jgi:hypothetical protein
MPRLPPYTGASRNDVEAMLEQIAEAGWPVFAHSAPNHFVVSPDDSLRLNVKYNAGSKAWVIECLVAGGLRHYLSVGDTVAMRTALIRVAKEFGHDLSAAPASIRLSTATPVGNRMGLVHLCAGAAVVAIFDPYFDDKAVANLSILCNMGLRLATTVRVLVTSKGAKRLTPVLLTDFHGERQSLLEVRVCASDKEHRRMLLLGDGRSLVLGCSLNDLSKNEAAHTEVSPQDLAFFDEQWLVGVPA